MFSLKMPSLAALAISATLLSIPSARAANDADFTLKNKTGYQIDEVYVSPHSKKSWGKDVMGTDALADGEHVKIVFPHGNGACMFDLMVKYHDDGSTAEWDNINLCETDVVSIFWDAKNQVSRATFE